MVILFAMSNFSFERDVQWNFSRKRIPI